MFSKGKKVLFLGIIFAVMFFCLPVSVNASVKHYYADATVADKTTAKIKWNKKKVDKYDIFRAACSKDEEPGEFEYIRTISGKRASFTDKNLKYKTRYAYQIKGYKKSGKKKKYKCIVNADCYMGLSRVNWDEYIVPDATVSPYEIELIYGAYEGLTPTGYEIYRKSETETDYTLLVRTEELRYVDTDVKAKETYQYKVRSYREIGEKIIYSKYSYVLIKRAVNMAGKYSIEALGEDGETDELIVAVTSCDENNGVTRLDGSSYEDIVLSQANEEFILSCTAYSYDNNTWFSFKENEDAVIEPEQTVYLKFTEESNKTMNIKLDEMQRLGGLFGKYNNLTSIFDFDFSTKTGISGVIGEYYH